MSNQSGVSIEEAISKIKEMEQQLKEIECTKSDQIQLYEQLLKISLNYTLNISRGYSNLFFPDHVEKFNKLCIKLDMSEKSN